MENLQLLNESTTKVARIAPTWGIEAGTLRCIPYEGSKLMFHDKIKVMLEFCDSGFPKYAKKTSI